MAETKKSSNVNPRLKAVFFEKGVDILKKELSLSNVHEVPHLEKIVINIGVSSAKENIKSLDVAVDEMTVITGQKPVIRKAKISVSAFKLREGMPIGVSVTLRGHRMYEFMDRFISLAVPRIRDFRGLNPKAFDGSGNYNCGIKEQYIFPEINPEKSDMPRGMNITFVTSAKNDEAAKSLLKVLGMPFSTQKLKQN